MEKIIATKENRGSIRIWLEESINNRYLSDNGFVKGSRFNVVIDRWPQSLGHHHILLKLDDQGKHKVSGKGDRSIIDIVRKAEKLPNFVNPKFADTFKLMADSDTEKWWTTGKLLIVPN